MNDSKSLALNTIRAEHRSLGAVINNMKAMLVEIREDRMKMDFPLFWSMVYYIDAFPNRLHHPKEDDWLFSRLQQRTAAANALIEELQRQHHAEPVALGTIRRDLGNFEAGLPAGLETLIQTVGSYAETTWKHLRTEEHEILPLAEIHLTSADWDDIATAFSQNADPLTGLNDTQALSVLFHDIVRKTPAPLGLGRQ
jgi:hemerythrin-like domain-containing protein